MTKTKYIRQIHHEYLCDLESLKNKEIHNNYIKASLYYYLPKHKRISKDKPK